MRTWIHYRYGGPEVLELVESTRPAPKAGEVLVRVMSTSVNRTDCANLKAKPDFMRLTMGFRRPRNPQSGTEFAGVVVALGEGVSSFNPGDRIFGFGDQGVNAHAEYLTIAVDHPLGIIPEGVSFGTAAVSLEGYHYARNILNKLELTPDHTALINGADGGIGSALAQQLRYSGITFDAVGHTDHRDLLSSLGARRTIDYTTTDFTREKTRYNAVFDCVGKSTYGRCRPVLTPGGAYISSELGPYGQNVYYSLFSAVAGRMPNKDNHRVKFPVPYRLDLTITEVVNRLSSGDYEPVIDRVFPFDQLPAAYAYVFSGRKRGNVSIEVAKE